MLMTGGWSMIVLTTLHVDTCESHGPELEYQAI